MKLKNEMVFTNIIILQIILLFFMPTVGNMSSPMGLITYFLFGVLSIFFIIFFLLKEKLIFNKPMIFVIGFYLICAITGILGMICYGNPFADVVRGILPFAWYLYIPCISRLSVTAFKKLNKVIKYVSILYALRILVYYINFVVMGDGSRVTLYLDSATAIMPIVGIMICIYDLTNQKIYNNRNTIVNFLMVIVIYISIAVTATKSMIISVFSGLVLMSILTLCTNEKKEKKKIMIKYVIIFFIFIIATNLIFSIDNNISDRWENGTKALSNINEQNEQTDEYYSDGSIAPRIEEYKVASDNFIESPIFGKGLGYRWESENVDYGEPVIFVHNVIMFVLMDMGLIGFFYVLLIIGTIIWLYIRNYKNTVAQNDKLINLALSVLVVAFIYGNMFAVFRTIEFTLLCAIFISMIIQISKPVQHVVINSNKRRE